MMSVFSVLGFYNPSEKGTRAHATQRDHENFASYRRKRHMWQMTALLLPASLSLYVICLMV